MQALKASGIGDPYDRIPQWTFQETRDFIAIRAQLENNFMQTKRNKTLWELIASKMREKGYRRSAEQCKCKWKNLVNRYKGIETQDPENGRQCPFFEELHAIFTEKMQRLLQLEAEGGSGRAKKKAKVLKSSDECSDEEEDDESEEEKVLKKRKSDRERLRVTAEKSRANSMHDVLEDFFKQQQNIEMQWRESVESREQDRRFREQEWREAMENLERERIFMERAWREREEQRRAREEARSEKRDALLTTLINRLIREDL